MFNLMSICSDYALAQYLHILKGLLTIIQIVAPIIAILMISIKLVSSMLNPDDKKNNKKIINAVLSLIIVFFIPTAINILMNIINFADFNLSTCWVEAENIYELEEETKAKDTKGNSIATTSDTRDFVDITTLTIVEASTSDDSNNYNDDNATIIRSGKKHNLTETQIKYLAAVCKREQGSAAGMRGEANLIANRYELYGQNYSSPYDYVRRSGWFGSRYVSPTNDRTAINIVRSVIVQGNRNVPLYIDEHDCWFCDRKKSCSNGNSGDICSITGGSSRSYITNRNNYKKNKTIINNVFGSKYTFYYFPASNSDPFGYTDTAYKKVNG